MSNAAGRQQEKNDSVEKSKTIKTANGNNVTDTQVESYRREKKRGTIARQEGEVALLLADGKKRNTRMIMAEMEMEKSTVNRNVNNLKKREIIPHPEKDICPIKSTSTEFYTLNPELLAFSTNGRTLEFVAELEEQLKTPIRDIPKLIIRELKKQGIFATQTRKRHVLAVIDNRLTQYLTEPINAKQKAELTAANVGMVECFSFDDFTALFVEKL